MIKIPLSKQVPLKYYPKADQNYQKRGHFNNLKPIKIIKVINKSYLQMNKLKFHFQNINIRIKTLNNNLMP